MCGGLRIEGLSNILLDCDIRAICAAHGTVMTATVVADPATGLGTGAAVVAMETDGEARKVKTALDGFLHLGRTLSVSLDDRIFQGESFYFSRLRNAIGRSGKGNPAGFGRSRA